MVADTSKRAFTTNRRSPLPAVHRFSRPHAAPVVGPIGFGQDQCETLGRAIHHAAIGFFRGNRSIDKAHRDILLNRCTILFIFSPVRIVVTGFSEEGKGLSADPETLVYKCALACVILVLHRLADFEHCDGRGLIGIQFEQIQMSFDLESQGLEAEGP